MIVCCFDVVVVGGGFVGMVIVWGIVCFGQ